MPNTAREKKKLSLEYGKFVQTLKFGMINITSKIIQYAPIQQKIGSQYYPTYFDCEKTAEKPNTISKKGTTNAKLDLGCLIRKPTLKQKSTTKSRKTALETQAEQLNSEGAVAKTNCCPGLKHLPLGYRSLLIS